MFCPKRHPCPQRAKGEHRQEWAGEGLRLTKEESSTKHGWMAGIPCIFAIRKLNMGWAIWLHKKKWKRKRKEKERKKPSLLWVLSHWKLFFSPCHINRHPLLPKVLQKFPLFLRSLLGAWLAMVPTIPLPHPLSLSLICRCLNFGLS